MQEKHLHLSMLLIRIRHYAPYFYSISSFASTKDCMSSTEVTRILAGRGVSGRRSS
ncbi:Protein HydE [Clarias magur]|uniref:Protein HydE n=1 Tax=Clarias magur TaxID=1594786 RepID=A0A8J4U5P4_CLAMG|nr:Protein HydE [Clarias magur]